MPALALVLAAGIYLAIDGRFGARFFVMWGLAAVATIGAVGHTLLTPRERRLIELSATSGDDYRATLRQTSALRGVQLAIGVVTVLLMALQP